jgi:hypothetical protein
MNAFVQLRGSDGIHVALGPDGEDIAVADEIYMKIRCHDRFCLSVPALRAAFIL